MKSAGQITRLSGQLSLGHSLPTSFLIGGVYFIPELPFTQSFLSSAVLVPTVHHAVVVEHPPSTHSVPRRVRPHPEDEAAETSQKSQKYASHIPQSLPFLSVRLQRLLLPSGPAAAPSPASRTWWNPSGSANATTPTSSPSFTNPTTTSILKR